MTWYSETVIRSAPGYMPGTNSGREIAATRKLLTYIEGMEQSWGQTGPALAMLLGLSLIVQPAAAATDGTAGATSTGSLQIRLTVAPEVRISALQDLALDGSAGGDFYAATPICVYARGIHHYQLLAQSSSAPADNRLSGYRLRYDDGTGFRALAPGTPLTALAARNDRDPDCTASGPDSALEVRLPAAGRQVLAPGIYVDTLRLTVAPE